MAKSGSTRVGKPQKSKRHKKIKQVDPFYKGPRAVDSRLAKSNLRPKNDFDQEVPAGVRQLFDLQQEVKSGNFQKKKNRNKYKHDDSEETVEQVKGMTRPVDPVPKFKQRDRETNRAFMARMDAECKAVMTKVKIQEEYKMIVDGKGDGTVKLKKKRKSKKHKEKLEKLKVKAKEKKEKKHVEKDLGFEKLQDRVEFGEVAMEPPSLSAKPRKSQDISTKKAGSKSTLLLANMFSGEGKHPGPPKREVGKTMKRKLLAPVQQIKMDAERERAIQLYREMKAKKMKMSDT